MALLPVTQGKVNILVVNVETDFIPLGSLVWWILPLVLVQMVIK